jgi:hypothetical protein
VSVVPLLEVVLALLVLLLLVAALVLPQKLWLWGRGLVVVHGWVSQSQLCFRVGLMGAAATTLGCAATAALCMVLAWIGAASATVVTIWRPVCCLSSPVV